MEGRAGRGGAGWGSAPASVYVALLQRGPTDPVVVPRALGLVVLCLGRLKSDRAPGMLCSQWAFVTNRPRPLSP